jgi:hypothetical protein
MVEIKTRLQKIHQKCIRNRPKTMLEDDYPEWRNMTDYHQKNIIIKFLSQKRIDGISKEELCNYNFTNIIYDKIQRKIISMDFSKKQTLS